MPVHHPYTSAYSFSAATNTTNSTITSTVATNNVRGSDNYSHKDNINDIDKAKYDNNICETYEYDDNVNYFNNQHDDYNVDDDDDNANEDESVRQKAQHKRQRISKNVMGNTAPRNNTHRYMDELEQFRGLGFATTMTDQQLLDILDECRGDLASLIERIT